MSVFLTQSHVGEDFPDSTTATYKKTNYSIHVIAFTITTFDVY